MFSVPLNITLYLALGILLLFMSVREQRERDKRKCMLITPLNLVWLDVEKGPKENVWLTQKQKIVTGYVYATFVTDLQCK